MVDEILCQINKIACCVASQENDGELSIISNLITFKNYLPANLTTKDQLTIILLNVVTLFISEVYEIHKILSRISYMSRENWLFRFILGSLLTHQSDYQRYHRDAPLSFSVHPIRIDYTRV